MFLNCQEQSEREGRRDGTAGQRLAVGVKCGGAQSGGLGAGRAGGLVRAAVGGKAEVGSTHDPCVSTHVALRWSDLGADSFHNP